MFGRESVTVPKVMTQPARRTHRLRVHVHAAPWRDWRAPWRASLDPFEWAQQLLRAMNLSDARVVAIGQRWISLPIGGSRSTERPGYALVIQYIDPWETRD